MEVVKDIFSDLYTFDIIYLVFTALSLITCTKKGFLLSILSASKWLLAYVVTLFLFPKVKPFFEDIIDSEYVLDIACLLYTSPSPRDLSTSRMPSSA